MDKFHKHKRIDGELGVWSDASKELPKKDGLYLVILETKSPNERIQSWAGIGEPELNVFHEAWHFKWSGRGGLTVAFWMPLPKFKKKWKKNIGKPGEWV